MSEQELQPWAFRIVRYVPRLDRDEASNLGVLLYSPRENRVEARLLSAEGEFGRIRRLHPDADLGLLRGFAAEFTTRMSGLESNALGQINKLDDLLSNTIQLGPQRGVLTADPAAELDRIYDEYVAPPRVARAGSAAEAAADSPAAIRRAAHKVFGSAGILGYMQPGRAATWTWPGDTLRLDFCFRAQGADAFAQALALNRDPAQAKAFAFTTQRIRAKLPGAQITAITDTAPQSRNQRHEFVRALLDEQRIEIVPLPLLEAWAQKLAAQIQ